MPKQVDCCVCFKRCKANSRRHIPPGVAFSRYIQQVLGRHVSDSDMVCNICTARIYKSLPKAPNSTYVNQLSRNTDGDMADPDFVPPPKIQPAVKSPKGIDLNIPATARSHKYCVVCHRYANYRNRMVVIPQEAATQAFIQSGIFMHPNSRCCSRHLERAYFNKQSLALIGTPKLSDSFSRTDIVDLVTNVRRMMLSLGSHLNFDIPTLLNEEDYMTLTGLTREQFDDLASYLAPLRNTAVRSVRTCLAVFLVKLRTGLSNKIIGVLFSLKMPQIQRIVASVRGVLISEFVPKHLGFNHISHNDFASSHNTTMAKTLFEVGDDTAIVVLDGTYLYIQKSSDYKFQRRSYSMHKNRPLVKPMVIVGTDGYILSVLGPYFADAANNDASITKHIMTMNEEANQWFNENDLFIVDRGFRDAVDFLEERGMNVRMPVYLRKGQKQHTTEDANLSRLVTKVRWVVESVNGRIKQWKMFDKIIPNTLLPHVGDFVNIVCAICNCYRPLMVSHDNTIEAEALAAKMLERSQESNQLREYLEQSNLITRRSIFKQLTEDDIQDFPRLAIEDLRNITFGVYQLKQAPFYSKEHKNDGSYEIMICTESQNLLKAKIQSRHTRSRHHSMWIRYDNSSQEPITGWYCTCKVGSRVVGCCAHIASVLWFLGWERHQQHDTHATNLCKAKILDSSNLQLETDINIDIDTIFEE